MARKKRKKVEKRVDYMDEKIPYPASIKRKVAMNFDKACRDLGISRNDMLGGLMSDFIIEVYKDKINREQ